MFDKVFNTVRADFVISIELYLFYNVLLRLDTGDEPQVYRLQGGHFRQCAIASVTSRGYVKSSSDGCGTLNEKMHRWGMKNTAVCRYGAEKQTAEHVLLYSEMLPSSKCVKRLSDTDDITVKWLLWIFPTGSYTKFLFFAPEKNRLSV